VSTATAVPQTHELEGDDALATLRSTGLKRLAQDAFDRFRAADGFSHARALAFAVTLTILPFVIAFVGLATVLDQQRFTDAIRRGVEQVAPGPASQIFTQAFRQGERSGRPGGGSTALVVGLVATAVAATTAMGQVERGANRMYGVEADRPTVAKYRHGFVLACSAGGLLLLAFVLLVAGSTVARALGLEDALAAVWGVLRWPLGAAAAVVAFALLFQRAPRRRQPDASWLAFGSAVAVVLWLAFTGLLALYLSASSSFGQTYGPLAGVIGVLLWAFASSVAVYLGLAFAAQLEAVRAGVPGPRTGESHNPVGGGAGARRAALQ
jgi:YihY family inner membrane protein